MQTILFTSERKQSFFLAISVRQFFLCSVEEFFVVCFPHYVRYHLVFFLVNIFFINLDNKLFFSAHIFNKLFFSDFCGDKPPRYQMVRPLLLSRRQSGHNIVCVNARISHTIYASYSPGASRGSIQPFNRRCRIYSGFHFLLAH